jgi:replicative superfamily II helicase
VYIAPLKALVRERIKDWNDKLQKKLGKKVVELTGDSTPDANAIASADVIVRMHLGSFLDSIISHLCLQ